FQERPTGDTKSADGNIQTEETALLNHSAQQPPEPTPGSSTSTRTWRQTFACPPQGFLALAVTNVALVALVWAVVWSITGTECLPGGNLFGIMFLYFFAVIGGKIFGLIKIRTLPPLPALLGMLLAGFLIRNIPFVSDIVQINLGWSKALRSISLSIILTRAGLGLDPKALKKLKAVCLRLSFGPCLSETCTAAVLAYLFMHLPWQWGFILGSLPSRRLNLMPVRKLCLAHVVVCLPFMSGSVANLKVTFPSSGGTSLSWKRSYLVLGLSMFAVFGSIRFGFPGSGGLCTLVLAFVAGVGWSDEKREVEKIVAVAWNIFQPFLFGLIGAEVSVTSLRPETVGLCVATLSIALVVRIIATFLMVCFAGFNFKEKVFISLAWIPKATVQAAIGSLALDTARSHQDEQLEKYGMDVLTVAFLAILITAPVGALAIGLCFCLLIQTQFSFPHHHAWLLQDPFPSTFIKS
uniref:Solute carrier family 9 member B2 n=1 Tax=Anas platyrhynchos platyrhynchos TaxID=8840 RepID=U3HZH5_ANAPP